MTTAPVEPASLRRNIRALPGAAWFLVGGAFANRFGTFAVVFLVLYLTRAGFGVARAGLVVAAYGVGEVLASLLGGHLADRIGRRATIALSMFWSAAAIVTLSRLDVYPAIVAVAFVAGIAAELYRPAANALVADIVPKGRRVTAYALLRLAVNLGFAAGAVLAGLLADHSFQWVFLGDAASSVAFGTIALTALPADRVVAEAGGDGTEEGYRTVLRDRALLTFLLASVLATFVYFQQQATLPLHVTGPGGLSNGDFGLLLAVNGAIVVLFELPLSAVTMHRPPRQMIALGFALIGVGFGLVAVARGFLALTATVVVWTLGEMVGAPVSYAYVADLAPPHLQGRYQGLYGVAWASGTVLGPALGALLYVRWGGDFWWFCLGVGLLAAALMAVPIRRPVAAGGSAPPR